MSNLSAPRGKDSTRAGTVEPRTEYSHEATALNHAHAMPLTIETIPETMYRYMHDAEASRIHAAAEALRKGKKFKG